MKIVLFIMIIIISIIPIIISLKKVIDKQKLSGDLLGDTFELCLKLSIVSITFGILYGSLLGIFVVFVL